MVHYLRTTPDGRIAFGWGGGRLACGGRLGGLAERDPDGRGRGGEADIRAFFPGLEGRRLDQCLGRPDRRLADPPADVVASTPAGRVFAAFGYTGQRGRPLADGRPHPRLAVPSTGETADSRLAFVEPPARAVPPEPLRYIGGTAIRAGLLRKERAEEAGRRPDPASRALAAVPALIGFHVGR